MAQNRPTLEIAIDETFSDGDRSQWPFMTYDPCDDLIYREKLARRWMEKRGEDRAGECCFFVISCVCVVCFFPMSMVSFVSCS